jgi:hypothetical protein
MHRLTPREFDLLVGSDTDDEEIMDRDDGPPLEPAVPSSLRGMFGG